MPATSHRYVVTEAAEVTETDMSGGARRDDPSLLVVGAGSIGRRHVANLRALGVSRLAVCDPDEERCAALQAGFHSV